MKNTTKTNKYAIAFSAALFALVFLVAKPVSAFADDWGVADTGTSNWGVADTGTSNWGVADTGTSNWGVADTGTSNWGVADNVSSYYYPSTYSAGYSSYVPGYNYNYNGTVTTGGFSGGTLVNVPPTTYTINPTVTSGSYYVPGNNTYYYGNNNLTASCSGVISNNMVTWTAQALGGNNVYNYYWSGDNFLSGSGQSITSTYTTSGIKSATLTVTSNGQTVTASCSVNLGTGNQVLAYSATNPNLSSVYLSDVPYTGAGDVARVTGFVLALIAWSIALAYYLLKRKEAQSPVLASVASTTQEVSNNSELSQEFVAEVSDDQRDIDSVIEYARSYKVILSSDAAARLVKVARTNGKNVSTLIQKMAGEEYVAIGEKDLEKYF